MTDEEDHGHEGVVIFIDRVQYRVQGDDLSGEQIRHLVQPPIGPDRDLWLEVPGGSDEKIEDSQIVELRNGMHFFTAPATINPGKDAASA